MIKWITTAIKEQNTMYLVAHIVKKSPIIPSKFLFKLSQGYLFKNNEIKRHTISNKPNIKSFSISRKNR